MFLICFNQSLWLNRFVTNLLLALNRFVSSEHLPKAFKETPQNPWKNLPNISQKPPKIVLNIISKGSISSRGSCNPLVAFESDQDRAICRAKIGQCFRRCRFICEISRLYKIGVVKWIEGHGRFKKVREACRKNYVTFRQERTSWRRVMMKKLHSEEKTAYLVNPMNQLIKKRFEK